MMLNRQMHILGRTKWYYETTYNGFIIDLLGTASQSPIWDTPWDGGVRDSSSYGVVGSDQVLPQLQVTRGASMAKGSGK